MSDRSALQQTIPQQLASTVEPRFHGFLGQQEDVAHVPVAQLHEVPQHDDGPKLGLDSHQCLLDLLAGLLALELSVRPRRGVGLLAIDPLAGFSRAEGIERLIDGNPVDPAVELETRVVLCNVFKHLAEYDPSFKFYSWIYRIAINESLNALGSRKPCEGFNGEEADTAPGPDRQLEGEQTGQAIEEALMRIKPELRAVVVLRHFMHLSYPDMGDILLLPEKTVKSRLYSARQLLRDRLLQRGAI